MGKDLANAIWEECKETIIKSCDLQKLEKETINYELELQKSVVLICYEKGYRDAIDGVLKKILPSNQRIIIN